MRDKGDNAGQLSMPFFGDLVPRGDGSYVLKPRKLDLDGETWVSVKEAQGMIGGGICRRTVERLGYSGEIKTRRLTPRKVEMSVASIHDYMARVKDPAYWDEKKKLTRARAATCGVQEGV